MLETRGILVSTGSIGYIHGCCTYDVQCIKLTTELATSQLVTQSSCHTVMLSLDKLVTSQLVTGAFFSQSCRHTVILSQTSIVQSYGWARVIGYHAV